jgi:Flp pilus assembly pilin Flp
LTGRENPLKRVLPEGDRHRAGTNPKENTMLNLTVFVQRKIADLKNNCKGVTAMEYGIIAAFTVAAIGGTIALIGGDLTKIWTGIQTQLATASASA